MTYKLHISPKAKKDIDKATEHYFKIQKKLAQRFARDLRAKTKYIHKKPLHIQVRYDSIRIAHLKKFPYSIHFAIEEQTIIILAVFHMATDDKKWTENLND